MQLLAKYLYVNFCQQFYIIYQCPIFNISRLKITYVKFEKSLPLCTVIIENFFFFFFFLDYVCHILRISRVHNTAPLANDGNYAYYHSYKPMKISIVNSDIQAWNRSTNSNKTVYVYAGEEGWERKKVIVKLRFQSHK